MFKNNTKKPMVPENQEIQQNLENTTPLSEADLKRKSLDTAPDVVMDELPTKRAKPNTTDPENLSTDPFLRHINQFNDHMLKEGFKPLWLFENQEKISTYSVTPLGPYDNTNVHDSGASSVRLFGSKGKLYYLNYREICNCKDVTKLKPRLLKPGCNAFIFIQKQVGDQVFVEVRVNRGSPGAHAHMVNRNEDAHTQSIIASGEFYSLKDGTVILVNNKSGHYYQIIKDKKIPAGKLEKELFNDYFSTYGGFYDLVITEDDKEGDKGVKKVLNALGYYDNIAEEVPTQFTNNQTATFFPAAEPDAQPEDQSKKPQPDCIPPSADTGLKP